MKLRTTITYKGTADPKMGGKRLARILKKANRRVAFFWHLKILPEHFEEGADTKYRYRPRSEKYLKSKRKRGKPPLVLTGITKQMATRSALIRATKKGATVRFELPAKAKIRFRDGRQNTMEEMKITVQDDLDRMLQVHRKRFQKGIEHARSRGRRRKRV